MCCQHQSAPRLTLSLHRASSELRNPFHLSRSLHGASITSSQGSRRGFEGPLPSTRGALFCVFTAEREKLLWPQSACLEGGSLQVKILLVSSYRAPAPRSPSNLLLWGHAVVGQTAKGMESPRLQLLRLLSALVFID